MKRQIIEYVSASIVLFVVLWVGLFSVLHIFYPVSYKEYVYKYSEQFNLDPSIVFSVMKCESGFNKNVISQKNAVGLMQITPRTGGWIADNMNIVDYSLMNPDTNIKFACWYLNYLSERFENTETTLAAYNAGEGVVNKWLENPYLSADSVSLVAIPYKETSNYVKNVMCAYNIYNKLY